MTQFIGEDQLNPSTQYSLLIHFNRWNEVAGCEIAHGKKGPLKTLGQMVSGRPTAQMVIFVRVAEQRGQKLTAAHFLQALDTGSETPVSRVKVAYPPAWNQENVFLEETASAVKRPVQTVDAWVKFTLAYLSDILPPVFQQATYGAT